jgi:low affinity Fe/Cu permease
VMGDGAKRFTLLSKGAAPPRPRRPPSRFTAFARKTSHLAGRPVAFCAASMVIVAWAATGSLFRYSDTWQLVINTSTTIVTFLMVFLIQNTQNRDSEAMHLKLDEVIRALGRADNQMLDLENLEDDDLAEIHSRYCALATSAREHLDSRGVEPSPQ